MIYEAKGFWARSYGWHRFASQHPRCWLFLPRCQAVHSFGLAVSLWVLFIDDHGEALGAWQRLSPNRLCWRKGAYGVIETAIASEKKRQQMQLTLLGKGWLKNTRRWEVDCFGQKCCEK